WAHPKRLAERPRAFANANFAARRFERPRRQTPAIAVSRQPSWEATRQGLQSSRPIVRRQVADRRVMPGNTDTRAPRSVRLALRRRPGRLLSAARRIHIPLSNFARAMFSGQDMGRRFASHRRVTAGYKGCRFAGEFHGNSKKRPLKPPENS